MNLIYVLTFWWCPGIKSSVVEKGCLLWPMHSLGRILLAFALLHFARWNLSVIPGIPWLPTLAFQSPIMYRTSFFFFLVLVLEGLVGHHRTDQLQFLWHQCLGNRLGLIWCWMVYLGNKLGSLCSFWECSQWGETKLVKMACSGFLTPCFVNNDYVTTEITYRTVCVHHEMLSWSWATLCCRDIWVPPRKWWHLLLYQCCVHGVSH